MQDIKQCKECGHENPKKFMGTEYVSHAPNCSQDKEKCPLDHSLMLPNVTCRVCGNSTSNDINKQEEIKDELMRRGWAEPIADSLSIYINKIISLAIEQEKAKLIAQIKEWRKENYFTDPTTNEEVADEILEYLSKQ